jgi:DNA (cytosine-5)-methyltransferase 1
VKPRLLDLFCGAGGSAVGYDRAGFDVVGVDVKPQPNYPFRFIQDDAIGFVFQLQEDRSLAYEIGRIDAIHASPPCQAYSSLVTMATEQRSNRDHTHPDLVDVTRDLLRATGLPYVIENVPGAPLIDPVMICGSAVGLPVVATPEGPRQVRRHRLFETNWPLLVPPCNHLHPALGTYGNGGRWKRTGRRGGYQGSAEECREGMGIDWTTRAEVAQAVPPAYTEHIGRQLLARFSGP